MNIIKVFCVLLCSINYLEAAESQIFERSAHPSLSVREKILLFDKIDSVDEKDFEKILKIISVCEVELVNTIFGKVLELTDDKNFSQRMQLFNNAIIARIKENKDEPDSILKLLPFLNDFSLVQSKKEYYSPKFSMVENNALMASSLLIDLLANASPDKRLQYLTNESFADIFATATLIDKEHNLFNKIFTFFLLANNNEEKFALLELISSRREFLSDNQITELVKLNQKEKDDKLASTTELVLESIFGKKPGKINWDEWINRAENSHLNVLMDKNKTIEARKIAYKLLCREISKKPGYENPLFYPGLRASVMKIIYDQNDDIELRKTLFFKFVGHANYSLEEKKKLLDPGFESDIRKILYDFLGAPVFCEACTCAMPTLFGTDLLKKRLTDVINDTNVNVMCRAGANWQLLCLMALEKKDKKEGKQILNNLINLLSEEARKSAKIDLNKLTQSDLYIINLFLTLLATKNNTWENWENKKFNVEDIKRALSL